MRNERNHAGVAAGIVLVGILGLFTILGMAGRPPLVGAPAPEIALKDLQGQEVRLSDLRGKIVLLNFWATWCKPCREEMPSMEVLHKNFAKDGLVVLAVSIDRVTTSKDIPPFIKSMNLSFPVLIDSWGKTDMPYKRMGVPETFIIDQQGVIREIVIGPRDWTRVDSLTVLLDLLKVTPKTVRSTGRSA